MQPGCEKEKFADHPTKCIAMSVQSNLCKNTNFSQKSIQREQAVKVLFLTGWGKFGVQTDVCSDWTLCFDWTSPGFDLRPN